MINISNLENETIKDVLNFVKLYFLDINLEPMDIDFFDFDNDNVKDILVTNNINYNGYSLKLYNFSFHELFSF